MEVCSSYSARSIQGEPRACSRQGLGQNDNSITLSLPASARTMSISELRCDIFQLVDLDSATRKKTLLALALTCASFTEMALDLLWQRLETFDPLIKCLPPSLWRLHGHKLTFQRAMTSEDWSIFCKYNHRVRSLTMTLHHLINTEVWAMITCPPFSFPLLPNLTSLTWHGHNAGETTLTFSSIRLFVTQKLTTLNVYAPYEVDCNLSIQSTLSSISIVCPSVSHFEFHSRTGLLASVALHSWFRLSSVSIGMIPDAAILHLAKLPSLQELHLEIGLPTISEDTKIILQDPAFLAFPALQEFSVICYSLASLDAIFQTLSIAPKRLFFSIHIDVDFVLALPASMSYISNACAHSAVEYLRIHLIEDDDPHSFPISAPFFQPFCAFRNLRKFDFKSDYDVDLDDVTFLQMAKAWPLLEELAIHEERYPNPHYITANSLVVLLQQCPRLTSVHINVGWSGIDQRDISLKTPYRGFVHENLSRADFCSSRIHYATGVAAFLSAIAPKLEVVCGWDCVHDSDYLESDKYSARWKAVQHLVKSFSANRERERRTALKAGGDGDGGIRVGGEDPEKDDGMESDTIHSNRISWGSEDEEFIEMFSPPFA